MVQKNAFLLGFPKKTCISHASPGPGQTTHPKLVESNFFPPQVFEQSLSLLISEMVISFLLS